MSQTSDHLRPKYTIKILKKDYNKIIKKKGGLIDLTYEEIAKQINELQRELAVNGVLINTTENIDQWQRHQQMLVRDFLDIPVIPDRFLERQSIQEQLKELELQLALEWDLSIGADTRNARLALDRLYQSWEDRRSFVPDVSFLSLRKKERRKNA